MACRAQQWRNRDYFFIVAATCIIMYISIINYAPYKPSLQDNKRVTILWTRWRSGSTTVGQLIANKPNTLYIYEPLHVWGADIMTDTNEVTTDAIQFIQALSQCNMHQNKSAIKKYYSSKFLMSKSGILKFCWLNDCTNASVIENVCADAERIFLKVLRLSLKYAIPILENNKQVKILYMMRDPRGVLKARSAQGWCHTPTCLDPSVVCNIARDDMEWARNIKDNYPNRFHMVRFEDINESPDEEFAKIWNFLGETCTEQEKKLVRSTFSENEGSNLVENPTSNAYWRQYPSQTKKNNQQKRSKTFGTHWREAYSYQDFLSIQNQCVESLESAGYRLFNDPEELKDVSISNLN